MSKYSYEFKKKVVMDYINGKGGYKSLCKENGIPSQTILRDWISAYKEFGNKGLMRSREKKNYSFEFKNACGRIILNNGSIVSRTCIEFRYQ